MSSKTSAEGLIRAGETVAAVRQPLWWQQSDAYQDIPFYTEMNMCCWGLAGTEDWQAAREALWAIREGLA